MNDPEELLVARLRSHDAASLGEYLAARRPQLLVFIERQLGAALRSKLEPDDVLQDVGVEAVRSFAQVDLAERDPFGWLCQIAERRIIDAHRRFFGSQKRAAGREVPLGSPGGDSQHIAVIDMLVASMTRVSQVFSRNQREIRLLAALDRLPAEHRDALRLRYLDGLPSKEVAQRLGKSDGAVRVMLTRSLQKLQEVLDEQSAE